MFIHMCMYKITIYHTITFLSGELLFYLLILNSPHRRLETALTGFIVKNVQKRFVSSLHAHTHTRACTLPSR